MGKEERVDPFKGFRRKGVWEMPYPLKELFVSQLHGKC